MLLKKVFVNLYESRKILSSRFSLLIFDLHDFLVHLGTILKILSDGVQIRLSGYAAKVEQIN